MVQDVEEFQDHLGYPYRTLAILIFHVTLMPPATHYPDASSQVRFKMWFGRCCVKNFRITAILDICTEQI